MEVQEKLLKQITETKYLNVENTERYRPIIRLFFTRYERLEYWLYKEDVYNELKKSEYFKDYTLELCEQDLNRLVEWLSLTSIQDTSNVQTVDEFKNRKFRYQLTEYAIEIERLVLRLENLKVKTSSLEPKLFEKIKTLLQELITLKSPRELTNCFEELNHNFTTLNESYKDFLKIFHEAKTEELMKKESFIFYKDKVINYLKDFIGGFQLNSLKINEIIKTIPSDFENFLMEELINYQKNVPNMELDFDYEYLREINRSKYRSIIKWFNNSDGITESARLKNAVNNIINKIMKNVAAILEMQSSNMNRKEEYKHILKLFSNCSSLNEAHQLASQIFGISKVNHYTTIEKTTDSPDYSIIDLQDYLISLESHNRKVKEKIVKTPIKDKSLAKESQLKEIMSLRKHEKEILDKYIQKGTINLKDLGCITKFERRFILSLISSGINKDGYTYNGEHGIYFKVTKISDDEILLKSIDGVFSMPDFKIEFGGQNE